MLCCLGLIRYLLKVFFFFLLLTDFFWVPLSAMTVYLKCITFIYSPDLRVNSWCVNSWLLKLIHYPLVQISVAKYPCWIVRIANPGPDANSSVLRDLITVFAQFFLHILTKNKSCFSTLDYITKWMWEVWCQYVTAGPSLPIWQTSCQISFAWYSAVITK